MDRDLKNVLKVLAAVAVLVSAVVALVLVVVKYKEQISDFLAEMKMKCPCCHREEDDYADEELNCICDMENMTE